MTLKEAIAIMDTPIRAQNYSVEVIMESVRILHEHWQNTDWDYRVVGEGFIALEAVLGSEEKAATALKAAGIKLPALKNGRRLYVVHEYFVRNGPADWAWFKALNFTQVNLLLKATAKHDSFTLRRMPLFDGSPANWLKVKKLAAN